MTRERSDSEAIAGAANMILVTRIKVGKNRLRAHLLQGSHGSQDYSGGK